MIKSYKMLFVLLLSVPTLFLFASSRASELAICLSCHGEETLEDESGRSLYVNKIGFLASVHGEALTCTDCHSDFSGTDESGHGIEEQKAECAMCHDEEDSDYQASIHAEVKGRCKESSPGCTTCHGEHYILSSTDPESEIYRTNRVSICIRCHESVELMIQCGKAELAEFVKSYDKSIHGRGVYKAGLKGSAVCTDCHGYHGIVTVSNERSPAWRQNIPRTCAQCHIGVYRDYKRSIHGQAFLKGIEDAPVCTDCHGEHTIQRPDLEEASTFATHIPETCSKCHEDIGIDTRYNLPSKRLASYMGSYHGVALSYGDVRVANCASCHGYHKILPSSDPESSIHPSNLQKTCGGCHPQAGRNFALGRIHVTNLKEQYRVAYIVRQFYRALIAGLMLAFLGLIALDLSGHLRRRKGGA